MKKTNCPKKRDITYIVGLISAIYHAVVHTGIVANVSIPWWVGAIGVAISAAFMYLSGVKNVKAKGAPVTGAGQASPQQYGQAAEDLMVAEIPIGDYVDEEFAFDAAPDEEESED